MTRTDRARGRRIVVRCEEAQEAISARLDGERPSLAGPALGTHLAGCQVCRDFETEAVSLGRQAGLYTTRPVPGDLVATLVPLLQPPRRGWLGSAIPRRRGQDMGLGWTSTAQWAGAMLTATLAVVALTLGVGSHPHLVPTRPPSPCTIGIVARHSQRSPQSGGSPVNGLPSGSLGPGAPGPSPSKGWA